MKSYPIKILQFGEGNFLRAFVEYMVDDANMSGAFSGSIAVIKPISQGSLAAFKEQDNKYMLITRGIKDGAVISENRIINSISDTVCAYEEYEKFMDFAQLEGLRFIISNTTEAGIAFDPDDKYNMTPPVSYPGKLTKFLYQRYEAFSGDSGKGLYILPCELIEQNGKELERCVKLCAAKWNLPDDFIKWLDDACFFCDTSVDRIVTGFDKELSEKYGDKLIDICEPFALWVIEDKKNIKNELPLDKAGLPVVFAEDVSPYRERKVRILNGAHTSIVAAALLCGKEIVRECMRDNVIRGFMEHCLYDEIIPVLKLDKDEVSSFAHSVFERFENPFIDHSLQSISLNSISKWKARVLCSLKDFYMAKNELPKHLVFSFAALLALYINRNVNDTEQVTAFFNEQADVLKSRKISPAEFVRNAAEKIEFWGEDLTMLNGFFELALKYYQNILEFGAYESLKMGSVKLT